MRFAAASLLCVVAFQLTAAVSPAAEPSALAKTLQELDTRVCPSKDEQKLLAEMLGANIRKRRAAANERETDAWSRVMTKDEWERFRDERIAKLRQSLGEATPPPGNLNVRVSSTLRGEGYEIENLVFESRPGLFVTAN